MLVHYKCSAAAVAGAHALPKQLSTAQKDRTTLYAGSSQCVPAHVLQQLLLMYHPDLTVAAPVTCCSPLLNYCRRAFLVQWQLNGACKAQAKGLACIKYAIAYMAAISHLTHCMLFLSSSRCAHTVLVRIVLLSCKLHRLLAFFTQQFCCSLPHCVQEGTEIPDCKKVTVRGSADNVEKAKAAIKQVSSHRVLLPAQCDCVCALQVALMHGLRQP